MQNIAALREFRLVGWWFCVERPEWLASPEENDEA
jgi:hypothetical protein